MNNQDNFNYSYNVTLNKKNLNIRKLIIIILVILLILVGVFLIYNLFFNKTDNSFNINNSTSFFLSNGSSYALFNEDGKQLTDFSYTYKSDFINGTAVVVKDDKYGIIDANGKMTVDFGKYSYIAASSGLYEATDDKGRVLINSKGKVLYDLENKEVHKYDAYLILEDKDDNNYKVINYLGKVILTIPIVSNVEEILTDSIDQYLSIFYNNKNYILNISTDRQLASFDSNLHYCVNDVYDSQNVINLSSCTSIFGSREDAPNKIIKDNKLYDLNNGCEGLYYSDNSFMCNIDYSSYLLDDNFNPILEVTGKVYRDAKNYAVEEGKDVKFYNNGNVTKTVSCRRLVDSGYTGEDLYALSTWSSKECGTEGGIYEFYNSNGEKAFDKTYADADNYDDKGNAIVSENQVNYYLINNKGEQVSNLYDDIILIGDYYHVSKDDREGLLDSSGKEIIPCEYAKIYTNISRDNYFNIRTTDDKYILYSIKDNKGILEDSRMFRFADNYFYTEGEGETRYYSYTTEKMFYEV